tara:strand:+ start:49 stop:279 length:231 start_codon:yes stop_codon:yes gene_type:complete
MTDKKFFRILHLSWWSVVGFALIIILLLQVACEDDIFIGGYNKDLEEIHYQMFEVDSLLRTINMELDSLAKRTNIK